MIVFFKSFISINFSTDILLVFEMSHKVSPLSIWTSAADTLDTVTPANNIPVAIVAAIFFTTKTPLVFLSCVHLNIVYSFLDYNNFTSLLHYRNILTKKYKKLALVNKIELA